MPFLFLVIVPFISSFGKGFGTKCPNLARTVSSKRQATDSCGEDSGRTRHGPLPVPRATIRCGFWIFCGMQPIVAAVLGDEYWIRRYPRCPLWGWCSAQRIKIIMIAGGNHTSVSCRGSGKGGAVGDFWLLPINEQHPLSLALLDSSPTGEPRYAPPNLP